MKPELLAPAGDMERLEYALKYGADAVYVAFSEFGMRAACRNFDYDGLKQAIQKCHDAGAKLYVTVNTYPSTEETKRLPAFFEKMEQLRPDAFIIADLGVLALAKQYAPHVELHVSTQANITSAGAAKAYYDLGAKRVVLARELSLEDIRTIRAEVPEDLELECFVHGAMCMSVSGRCHLSAFLTGRDANRGACTQPCRWSYAVMEETRPGQYFPVEQDGQNSYIFNSKDLCMVDHIGDLIDAGIHSFKIEGRMKTFYYVASTVKAYREAIDEYVRLGALPNAEYYKQQVGKASHRDFSTGFFYQRMDADGYNYQDGGYVRPYEVVAVVEDWKDGVATVRQKNKFSVGDELEVLCPNGKDFTFTVERMNNADGEVSSAPHAGELLQIPCDTPLCPMDILRKKK